MSRREHIERKYIAGAISVASLGLEPDPMLEPGLMSTVAHETILDAIATLIGFGDAADADAIVEHLRSEAKLNVVDPQYVHELLAKHYDPKDRLGSLAHHIRSMAEADRMAGLAALIASAVKSGDHDKARELASKFAEQKGTLKAFEIQTGRESAEAALAMATDPGESGSRIELGDDQLDRGIGTLGPGTMMAIGADTNVGKSTLALFIAERCGLPVGIVSTEDPKEVYGARLLSAKCGVSSSKMFNGTADIDDVARMRDGVRKVSDRTRIAYAIGSPVSDVLNAINSLVSLGARLIVVDYIQNIRVGTRVDRKVSIADAVTQIKALCARLGVALIVCSQLSRPAKDKPFREPTKYDLKESGDIENMCEVIVLLWRMNDKPNAQVYGKVDKLKWGMFGHRFKLERDDKGNLYECSAWGGDYPKPHSDAKAPLRLRGAS